MSRPLLGLVVAWEVGKSAVKSLGRLFGGSADGKPAPPPPREQGRSADRDFDPGRQTARHERWGAALVATALAVSFAGGVLFLVVYWHFGSTQLLGATLAVFLGGLGVAVVLHGRWLMLRREATEPRERLSSPPQEKAAAAGEFRFANHEIHRRGLLATMVVIAGGIVTGAVVALFRSLGSPPDPPLESTVWKRGQRLTTSEGKPVRVDTLVPGSTVIVFPEDKIGDERAQTVLIRVPEDQLHLPNSRVNWAPMGYVAYSRVCTHAGCPVGLYLTTTETLMCPCHQSTFDILRAAQPTGGPAARALPQLPLYADENGILRAAGGFSAPPGPGFWGMRA